MSCLKTVVERHVYFSEAIKSHKLAPMERVYVKWYNNVDRKGEPFRKIYLPQRGGRYQLTVIYQTNDVILAAKCAPMFRCTENLGFGENYTQKKDGDMTLLSLCIYDVGKLGDAYVALAFENNGGTEASVELVQDLMFLLELVPVI